MPGKSGAVREHRGAAAGFLLVSRAEGVMGSEEEVWRFSDLVEDEWLWRWQILLPRWKQKSKGVSWVQRSGWRVVLRGYLGNYKAKGGIFI